MQTAATEAGSGMLDADDRTAVEGCTTGHEAVALWVREMKPRRPEVLD